MEPLRLPTVAGADGCRSGWVVATPSAVKVLSSLPHNESGLDIVGVDMPVGLAPGWHRQADVRARAFLPNGRKSSVFPTLPRSLLDAASYEEANHRSRSQFGRGLSRQSWGLAAKIREVDACARTPGAPEFVEIHPECSFWAMTGRVLQPKRTPAGNAERREALRRWYPVELPDRLPGAGPDDICDAVAVLWSALRYARGEHLVLGDGSPDAYGLPMRIVV